MKNATWADCAAFHGHECGGLTIGYKASLYAIELLGLTFSGDEEVCCISENDACGVDAVQVMLGCSAGKGNLMFHLTGKQAFTFYERRSGRGVRLVLRPKPEMTRAESFEYYQSRETARALRRHGPAHSAAGGREDIQERALRRLRRDFRRGLRPPAGWEANLPRLLQGLFTFRRLNIAFRHF